MADLLINKNETAKVNEEVGQNLLRFGTFESAPAFIAATTASSRWIDGSAAGSTTNDIYGWEIQTATGTVSAQFDNANAQSGTYSLKISTLATASRVDTGIIINASTVSNIYKYGIPVYPSTTYKISYYMKTQYNSGAGSSGATLRITEYSSAGATGASANGTVVATTTAFTLYTFNVTTASTANYINVIPLIIGNTGTATLIMDAWYDDIVITPISRIAGTDLQVTPLITPGIQDIRGPKIWS
jgi:hypothetical protein